MIFFMFLLIFLKVTEGKVGSTIFYNRNIRNGCWSEEDIAKLRARKAFEDLIPPEIQPIEINSKYINNHLRFFRRALRYTENEVEHHTSQILKESLLDAIGAHLRSEILPSIRIAYYAGYVPYRKARQMEDFLDEIKLNLNTQGLGWKTPDRNFQWSNLNVSKLNVGIGKFSDSCSHLVTKRDMNSCIHLPTPKFDDSRSPTAMALPFKSGGLINLASSNSANVLMKYYTTASRCILKNSPEKCRHSDFVAFNNEMWHWMKRSVAPHLADEKLYAAYGGVLRIAAAVQTYGKGLSRRNLFDYKVPSITKWRPWKELTESCKDNFKWTPNFYICLVLIIAVGICLLQVCYACICGNKRGCNCRGPPVRSCTKEVAYTNIESTIPAMLPDVRTVLYDEEKSIKHSESRVKTAGSVNLQKVYDLNENKEEIMDVEISETDSDVSTSDDVDTTDTSKNKVIVPGSPPKLQPSVSEIRIGKTRSDPNRMYSTSTLSRSDTYGQRYGSESWSDSETSSSSESCTSVLSQSKSRLIRSSSRLMPHRMISNQSYEYSSSVTLNANSYQSKPIRR